MCYNKKQYVITKMLQHNQLQQFIFIAIYICVVYFTQPIFLPVNNLLIIISIYRKFSTSPAVIIA